MNEGGEKVTVVETTTYVVTSASSEPFKKKGIHKKHALIVVGLVVLAGLIITGILVGMYIFAEAQKEIVKFSMEFKSSSDNKNIKQEVESDPNDNVVMFHVTKDGQNTYIVNDYNRDMQVIKVITDSGTNCYVSALNRSAAADPSQISAADANVKSTGNSESVPSIYTVSRSPVSDRSFLPKKAQDMCNGVSVYWAFRSCNDQQEDSASTNSTSPAGRQRRATVCITGCNLRVCSSCWVRLDYYYSGGTMYCTFTRGC